MLELLFIMHLCLIIFFKDKNLTIYYIMQTSYSFKLLPQEAADTAIIRQYIANAAMRPVESISGYTILKHSMDARSRTIWINLQVLAYLDEPAQPRALSSFGWKMVGNAERSVIIVGAGPAGLFAALECLLQGIKPIVLERGKNVRDRRRDLADMNKTGEVNPESNYCFGEGGAGTYSDGKLYTRSNKRGDLQKILQLFVHFGAKEEILYEAHPHIGTNKLPQIISAMRDHIVACGGEIHFSQKVVDLQTSGDRVTSLVTEDGLRWEADAFVLATGHSARDIFQLLHTKKWLLEAKPFALGVRVEHPQSIIDASQYHLPPQALQAGRGEYLPPASYSLVHQVSGRGVFSFCMCPGGIIAPAATAPGEIVVNGWSPSKRNNPYANSGTVVEVRHTDLQPPDDFENITGVKRTELQGPLGMMYFQMYVERKAFAEGGGSLKAPAQRLEDFIQRKTSADLPACSYIPGIVSGDLKAVLPAFVHHTLREGLVNFGKKMKGYRTNDAVLVATESRTSSPVRIPREADKLHHPQYSNFYPCAEGAGYAGGIVSAAMDGLNIISTIAVIYP